VRACKEKPKRLLVFNLFGLSILKSYLGRFSLSMLHDAFVAELLVGAVFALPFRPSRSFFIFD
jgi:hypothetical protein